MKRACSVRRLTVMGNLNGITMRRWTPAEAEQKVQEVIVQAGRGGGFILSDNHGEIPWQVPDSVLLAISQCGQKVRDIPAARVIDAGAVCHPLLREYPRRG